MMIAKIENNTYTVDSLTQWDRNQTLEIHGLSLSSVPEIHFNNTDMDRSIVRQSVKDDAGIITVDIPNSLLQKPYTINVYVCVYQNRTFITLYKIAIPVKARNKPLDYTITDDDEEIYSFVALENAITNLHQKTVEVDNRINQVEGKMSGVLDQASRAIMAAEDAAFIANAAAAEAKKSADKITEDSNNANAMATAAKQTAETALEKSTTAETNATDAKSIAESANATATIAANAVASKAPGYTYGTADKIAGSSALATGVLYFVYD